MMRQYNMIWHYKITPFPTLGLLICIMDVIDTRHKGRNNRRDDKHVMQITADLAPRRPYDSCWAHCTLLSPANITKTRADSTIFTIFWPLWSLAVRWQTLHQHYVSCCTKDNGEIYSVLRKKHPLLFSCITLRKSNQFEWKFQTK